MTTIDPTDTLIETVDSATDSIDRAMQASYGSPTISLEEVKAALLMTHRALMYQSKVNDALLDRVRQLENRKKLFRRK